LKKEILVKKDMLMNSRKKWTLDEDGDDDEEAPVPDTEPDYHGPDGPQGPRPGSPVAPVVVKMEIEDDEDPLDAFMKTVQAEVRKVNHGGGKLNDLIISARY